MKIDLNRCKKCDCFNSVIFFMFGMKFNCGAMFFKHEEKTIVFPRHLSVFSQRDDLKKQQIAIVKGLEIKLENVYFNEFFSCPFLLEFIVESKS